MPYFIRVKKAYSQQNNAPRSIRGSPHNSITMKLTLTKQELAVIHKLVIDRKYDIRNIGGDDKQYDALSKLNKKIARQARKFYKI